MSSYQLDMVGKTMVKIDLRHPKTSLLLLRGNTPSTVILTGPKELNLSEFYLSIVAKELIRKRIFKFYPSQLSVSLGDDTPLQIFPIKLVNEGFVITRDLAGVFNLAWQRALVGNIAIPSQSNSYPSVPLRLTSATDGLVEIKVSGTRQIVNPREKLKLDAMKAQTLTIPWPVDMNQATLQLWLNANFTGGRRMKWGESSPNFFIRLKEGREVAQAFRIAAEGGVGRQITALWISLPKVPSAEEKLEFTLVEVAGEPPYQYQNYLKSATNPLATFQNTLPADSAQYQVQEDSTGKTNPSFWFRIPLAKPLYLNGTQVAQTLCLIIKGKKGTPLLNQTKSPADEKPTGWHPAFVRNLANSQDWELITFNQTPAFCLMDLELAPIPGEELIRITNNLNLSQAVACIESFPRNSYTVEIRRKKQNAQAVKFTFNSPVSGTLEVSAVLSLGIGCK